MHPQSFKTKLVELRTVEEKKPATFLFYRYPSPPFFKKIFVASAILRTYSD